MYLHLKKDEELKTNRSEDSQQTRDLFFVHMSVSLTVAMARTNRKDDHFLLFSTYLLPFLELPSVKYFQIRQSSENDFGQYVNLKKRKVYLVDSE